ncbi:MAG: hypothetical protein GEU96_07050, partial [Propionibacteriales bacterium]|nr:hypothetical protein [Propionibacteriales bacterium]
MANEERPGNGRRLALVVANHLYQASLKDATTLADLLGDPSVGGFAVELLLDRRREVVLGHVDRLFHESNEDDVVLLYLGGDIALLPEIAFRLPGVQAHAVVVLIEGTEHWAHDLVDPVGAHGVLVIGAAAPLEDRARGRSPLTRGLVTGLTTGAADLDHDGEIDADEFYGYLQDLLRTWSPEYRLVRWRYGRPQRTVLAHSRRAVGGAAPQPPMSLPQQQAPAAPAPAGPPPPRDEGYAAQGGQSFEGSDTGSRLGRWWRRMRDRPESLRPPRSVGDGAVVDGPVSGGRFTGSVLAYPHIGGPEAVVVGTPFDVTIGLSPRRDRSLVTAGALALPPGKPIDVGLMVTYDPDSLRLETPLPTTIRVNPANPYVVVAARFVALDGDDLGAERRIGVHYLLDGVVIGVAWKRFVAAWDESELAGLPRPDPRERTLLNLAPVLREEAPDLVVAVYRADDATGDYFVWSAYPSMSGFAVPDTQRSGRIGDESKQFATDGRRSVAQGGDPVGLFTQLHGRALDIGRAIPVAMRETLRELATGRET